MISGRHRGPSYHSSLPDGTQVHETRGSLWYALHLLHDGSPARTRRAGEVIRRVLGLQCIDPCSPTYGIWPYYLEEPLEQMSPPDWNWADFCGASLASMLGLYPSRLDEDLVLRVRDALGHAAWSIFRRNIQADYTNIAVMGGVVTAAAGELLAEPRLLDYGRRRLQRVVEHVNRHGGFAEYNSPTYSIVTLVETERALQLLTDPQARTAAETLRRRCWELIASQFHPPTRQWAGPHARTYADLLASATLEQLEQRIRLTDDPAPAANTPDPAANGPEVRPLPCPPHLKPNFERLPVADHCHTHTFGVDAEGRATVIGTTWMHPEVALGSVSGGELWTQRRPLIGYLAGRGDAIGLLRVRLLKDGQDFASGYLRCAQQRHRVLCLLTMLHDAGDFHLHLDHPPDGIFRAHDLRLRIELTGEDVSVSRTTERQYALRHGDWRAVVHLPETAGVIIGHTPRWQCGQTPGHAAVEAVVLHGPEQPFALNDPASLHWLAFGLELLRGDEPGTDTPVTAGVTANGTVEATWPPDPALRLAASAHPGRRG
jgi:hypothetical protein